MDTNTKKEKKDIRIVFLVFSAIFSFVAWRLYPSITGTIFLGIVLFLLPALTFFPTVLRPLFRLWMKFAAVLGKFNAMLLLTIIFLLIILPMGLIMRILRKDPMKRRIPHEGSYWESCELDGIADKNRYEHQY